MNYNISGNGFSMLEIDLEPNERLFVSEASLVSIEADVEYSRSFLGGLFKRIWIASWLKQEVPILRLRNLTESTRHIMLTHPLPGELRSVHLHDESICIDPHALVARYGSIKIVWRWAGWRALLAKQKPFNLLVKGTGIVWIGAYGGLLEKQIDGEYTLDTHHLIAYQPSVSVSYQPAGGFVSGLVRGEGFVTRVVGHGSVTLQTKSVIGLGKHLNNH